MNPAPFATALDKNDRAVIPVETSASLPVCFAEQSYSTYEVRSDNGVAVVDFELTKPVEDTPHLSFESTITS